MPYKDKDKQRAADRARQKRRRDRIKVKGVTKTGCDDKGVTESGYSLEQLLAKDGEEGTIDVKTLAMVDAACGDKLTHGLPANYGQPDCQCMHCKSKRVNNSQNIINHGPWKPVSQLARNEVNRVTLPGDIDYEC